MRICFVRHGEFSYSKHKHGQVDGHLTEKGIKQAVATAFRFRNKRIHRILSSDMMRTLETSRFIASEHALEVELRSELREINRGEWEYEDQNNPKYAPFRAIWEKHEEDLPYPHGECGKDVLKRVSRLINEITGVESHSTFVVLVTHGGVIRTLLAEYTGQKQEERFIFHPGLCSITTVEYDGTEPRIIEQCNVQHLNMITNTEQTNTAGADGRHC